ncbi:MAG: succinylglutamate desuccinylase/aspartoacylase family protein [Bacillota bacterium]
MSFRPFGYEFPTGGIYRFWMDFEGSGFPVVLVGGTQDGPTLLCTAGVHGSEYAGIEALYRLPLLVDAEGLCGRIVALPLVNVPAFQARAAHICPRDGKNLNRVFPGRPDGTYSERLAHLIAQELVVHADYVLDMHGADLGVAVLPLSAIHLTGAAPDDPARELARGYGLPYLVQGSDEHPWGGGGTLFAFAARQGKVAAMVQSGSGGNQPEQDDVALHAWGLLNTLKALGMQPGAAEFRDEPVRLEDVLWVTSDFDGRYRSWVEPGERVRAGQILGNFYDYTGQEVKIQLAPSAGMVLYGTTSPAAPRGTQLAGIGRGPAER